MPTRAPRRCTKCGQLNPGQCPACTKPWARRPSKSWGTYANTGDRRWRQLRRVRLAMDPLCSCGKLATEVDHLDGTDYGDHSRSGSSWLNLNMTRSLCLDCHRRRTSQQGHAARG